MSEAPKDAKTGLSGLDAEVHALARRARRGLPARAAALREAALRLRSGDGEAASELRRLAHRLHGTAGSYGMRALGDEAAEVEALAVHGDAVELASAALMLALSCDAEAGGDARRSEAPPSAQHGTAQRGADAAETSTPEQAPSARVRALIVDDDPAIGRLVGLLLERMGNYEVEVVDSPAAALEKLDAGLCPSLLVVDAMMPDMNGRALAQAARRRPGLEALPVAMLSAATAQELGWDDGEFTPDAWITKPVRAAELLAALRKLR